MTDIDPGGDIEVSRGFAQVTVRIPLAGQVSRQWVSHHNSLAHKWIAHSGNENAFPRAGEGVLETQGPPDRGWIVVRLPAALDRAVVQSVLDAARGLITEADAAEQAPQTAETEAVVREWWAHQQGFDACCPRRAAAGLVVIGGTFITSDPLSVD